MKIEWTEVKRIFSLLKKFLKVSPTASSRKNCGACENLAIRKSQIGSTERRTFTFEQQRAQLDFIVQGNEFLI